MSEREVTTQTGAPLPPPSYEITLRVRDAVRYRELIKIALQR
jgi:hypothetical protein